MMAFTTRCCANASPEGRWRLLARAVWALVAGLCLALAARAEPVEVAQLRLERGEEAVYLSATLQFDLPQPVEDALTKGVPLVFVAEATLYRDRWYWWDKRLLHATRRIRLSYLPLTQRWRVATLASGEPAAANVADTSLGQNFDNLPQALSALQRISRWRIGDAQDVEPDARHTLEFRFRLDQAQLPRLFQIGAIGQSDWTLATSRTVRLPVEPMR